MFFPAGKMSASHIDNTLPKLATMVKAILEEHKGQKGIIHCHSYKIAKYLKNNIKSIPSEKNLLFNLNNELYLSNHHKIFSFNIFENKFIESDLFNKIPNIANKEIWGESAALQWREIPVFLDFFKDGKVIHAYRDPRGVFASWTKISSIPNSSSFSSQPLKKNDQVYSKNELNFLTIARFDHQKDHRTLFKGLSLLPKELKWKMVCVGDGPLFEKTKDYGKRLNLESKIIFTGFQKNLEVFFRLLQ